jgi:hypothetical protein
VRLLSPRDKDKFPVSKDILSEPARGRQEAEAGKESEEGDAYLDPSGNPLQEDFYLISFAYDAFL